MKKTSKPALAAIFIIPSALLFLTACRRAPSFNPNLMTAEMTWQSSDSGREKLHKLLSGEEKNQSLRFDKLNSNYLERSWSGRILHDGVSYHALFALDETRITIRPQTWSEEATALSFTIYNDKQARLFYRVGVRTRESVKWKKQTIYLYKGFFEGRALEAKTISLAELPPGIQEIVLETSGSGIGAWINPRLVAAKPRPKVFVLIVLDALRADHLSLYGYERPTSPFLESLSQHAQVYRNAFSTTSWTLPALVSLFSGREMERHSVFTPNDTIPEQLPLLAEIFQQAGFLTAAFTGGGFVDDSYGFARGFGVYSNNPGMVFLTDSAEKVLNHFHDFIEANTGSDMFLFLHTYQTHAPYKAPPEYIVKVNPELRVNMVGIRNYLEKNSEYFKELPETERRKMIDLYDASIMYCDRVLVGGVIDYLRGNDLFADAMLVVMSDHGQEFYDHHSWEHGHSLYRELIHIPLVIKYPGNHPAGEDESLISVSDIAAKILAAGSLPYDRRAFPGSGRDKERVLTALLPLSPIVPQFPGKIAFINRDYHFIFNFWQEEHLGFFDPPPLHFEQVELYRTRDKRQLTNLADRRVGVVNEFLARMVDYNRYFSGVEMQEFKLDKELEKRLRSLGYLGGD